MRKRVGVLLVSGAIVGAATFYVGRTLPVMAGGATPHNAPWIATPQTPAALEPVYKPDTPANRKLHDAIQKGNLIAVKSALKEGGDPEAVVTYGNDAKEPGTPLAVVAGFHFGDEWKQFLPIFRLLAERVKDVNLADGRGGMTLLMQAVEAGDLALVRSLVGRGAMVDAVTKIQQGSGGTIGSETALYQAVQRGGDNGEDPDPIALYLIERGANVNHVCADGSTALMRAAQHGKIDTVRVLLSKGADPAPRDSRDFTALRWASLRGRDKIVALLEKRTPMNLWEAATLGNAARVRELLAAGADPNTNRPVPEGLGTMPGDKPVGETPLAAAVKSDDVATVQALIDAGADVRYAHPRTGKTALHNAAIYGSTKVIPLLIARGADVNALAVRRDANGKPEESQYYGLPPGVKPVATNRPPVLMPHKVDTPLTCAVEGGEAETVSLLLRSGVIMTAHDQGNVAFLRLMRNSGQEPRRPREQKSDRVKTGESAIEAQDEIMEALVEAGADLEKTGAVVVAVQREQPGVVEYLLEKGASPNAYALAMVGDDETALMAAIQGVAMHIGEREVLRDGSLSGPEEDEIDDAEATARRCLEILLKAGADVNAAAGQSGKTPLMTALENNVLPLAADLLKRGAKVDATDGEGRTALMRIAAEGENIAGAAWLLRNGAKPNAIDKNGFTALMLAVDNGANAEWEAFRKMTAEDRKQEAEHMREFHGGEPAEEQRPNPDGHPKMVTVLVKGGADKTVVAKDGKTTALTLAHKNGFKQVIALLTTKAKKAPR
jgi:ankyrin repeat protein